jgi:hypothetical protein
LCYSQSFCLEIPDNNTLLHKWTMSLHTSLIYLQPTHFTPLLPLSLFSFRLIASPTPSIFTIYILTSVQTSFNFLSHVFIDNTTKV